jgi:integrase
VNKAFAELSAAVGVRRIRFHDLRHSCASLLYELGVPIENIQDVLGHSTPVITKLLYVDGSEKVQRGAADRLGKLFGA